MGVVLLLGAAPRVAITSSTAVVFLGGGVSAMAVEKPTEPRRTYHLPRGDASTTLLRVARLLGRQVLFLSDKVQGEQTNALAGDYTPREALDRMLANTALVALEDEATGGFVVSHRPSPVPPEEGGQNKPKPPQPKSEHVNPSKPPGKFRAWLSNLAHDATTAPAATKPGAGVVTLAPFRVTVSALKREEDIQEVPMAVSAMTGNELKERGAVDLKDILLSIPGVCNYGGFEGRGLSTYVIRGVNGGLSTTGIYLDDVLLNDPGAGTAAGSFSGGADVMFFDMERVEVLKGPQGTLYGGATMGGAVKYVSARPNFDAFSGSSTIGLATTADGALSRRADAIANIPLIPGVLAIRGGLYFNHEGGYIDNIANANVERAKFSSTPFPTYTPSLTPSASRENLDDANYADTFVGRVSALWVPDPSWSIRPAMVYQDSTQAAVSAFYPNYPGKMVASSRFLTEKTADRLSLYSLDINKKLGGVELTSLTSYYDRKMDWDRDYSWYVLSVLGFLPWETSSFAHYPGATSAFTQELRISSGGGADARLYWVAGLYFRDQDSTFKPSVQVFNGIAPFDGEILDGNRHFTATDQAAFGEATFKFNDALALTAGVRFYQIEQTDVQRDGGIVGNAPTDLESKEDGVNPKASLAYKIGKNHLLYTSAAKGFRPGGPINPSFNSFCAADYAALGLSGPPTQYESDQVWTYEIGSKNEFNDGRILVNGAVFQTDWDNIQQTVSLPGCGQSYLSNAGGARIRGGEIEARFNLTHAVQVGANLTFTHSEYTDSGKFGAAITKGAPVVGTPKWMGGAYASYYTRLNRGWTMLLRADYQYRGGERSVISATPTQNVVFSDGVSGPVAIDSAGLSKIGYEMFNASASFTYGATNVRFYVNNVFDERPLFLGLHSEYLGISRTSSLRPRTIGFEVQRQF